MERRRRGEGAVVAQKVKENESTNFGYNALTHEYGDMLKMGVIVPTKVERSALQNAAPIAALLLTTDAVVSELRRRRGLVRVVGCTNPLHLESAE